MLMISLPTQTYALSDKQLEDCLKKMPKNLTNAEKSTYKKKCNSQERTTGKFPPGFVAKPGFNEIDLLEICMMYKFYQGKDRKTLTDALEKEYTTILKHCQTMYKDPIWKNANTLEKQKNIVKYYAKGLGVDVTNWGK